MFEKLNITHEEFLSAYFAPPDTVCLRVFDDHKGGAFKGAKMECEAAKIGDMADNLRRHNRQERGIFFTVNSGGHTDAEISRINAQFVEMDEASFDEQEARISAFPLPPSVVVRTRKSYHVYWLMECDGDGTTANVSKFRHIQKQLVAHFDGDPACVNESRVMRLPGFNHCKQEPVEVVCVLFAPERRYSQEQLTAVLPKIALDNAREAADRAGSGTYSQVGKKSGDAPKDGKKGDRKGLSLVGKRCDFIQHCKANAATLPEGLWYGMIANLAVFDGGGRVIHALSKPYQGYSYVETQDKINHFLESGTKPMTCAKIAECGFRCPKMSADGGNICDCKSPAALAYKPLSGAELLECLNTIDIPSVPIDKMAAALNFVKENLFNIEPATAETLINYDLKARFDFKANDLRPLISAHRELYKKFVEGKERREKTSGYGQGGEGEIPPWYEVTDKGGLKFLPGVLAAYLRDNFAAFYSADQYYLYADGVYNAADLEAKAVVRSFLVERQTTLNNVNDAEGQWRMSVIKPLTELNADPFVINVKNGLYNVKTDALTPHTPDYFSTVQLNVNYQPNAQCPTFLKYLEQSYNAEDIPLVQEMFGYFLVPETKAQKALIIVGAPGAGKSLNKILLGQKNVSNVMWQSLNERFKTAELFGKYGNIFADLPSKAIDDNGSATRSYTIRYSVRKTRIKIHIASKVGGLRVGCASNN